MGCFDAYESLKDVYEVTFFEVFRNLTTLIKENDLMRSYLADLAIGYLLTIIAASSYVIRMFKNT